MNRGDFLEKPAAAAVSAAHKRRPHVVIVGAGFAGLAAAQRLSAADADVTVIDKRNHHLFQPLLYQVATAALSPAEIAQPIRSILRDQQGVTVMMDEVTGIDPHRKAVYTQDHAGTSYDFLILAPGSRYSYFGHEKSWPRHAPGLKSLEDAIAIRRKILLAFERAEASPDAAERQHLMTFVLVGAGATGVEMAGAISELAKAALACDFRHIDPRAARIILVEAGAHVLPAFRQDLRAYALKTLRKMDVDVRLNTRIEDVLEDGVIANGEKISASTVIWSAGVKANPAGEWLGVETGRGGAVKVKDDLSVADFPDIYVAGDAAFLPDAEGHALPGLAPVAKQQGAHAAAQIEARLAGKPSQAFRYKDRGMLATIGRSSAIVDIGRLKLKGFPAWVIWGAVHIYFLIGFRSRMAVFADWVWAWVTFGRGARLITGAKGGEGPGPSPLEE